MTTDDEFDLIPVYSINATHWSRPERLSALCGQAENMKLTITQSRIGLRTCPECLAAAASMIKNDDEYHTALAANRAERWSKKENPVPNFVPDKSERHLLHVQPDLLTPQQRTRLELAREAAEILGSGADPAAVLALARYLEGDVTENGQTAPPVPDHETAPARDLRIGDVVLRRDLPYRVLETTTPAVVGLVTFWMDSPDGVTRVSFPPDEPVALLRRGPE